MKNLTKTLLWALVGMSMGYFMSMGDSLSMRMLMMMAMAGLPAGWNAVGRLRIVTLSWLGFVIRLLLAVFVGWVALPIELFVGIKEVREENVR